MAARDAIAEWARITYGWMGRSPDYKAAFLATLGANSDFYEPYRGERPALVQEGHRRGLLRQPRHRQPAGRSRQAARRGARTSTCTSKKETDDGLIVSGAKVVATTSTLTHYNFIANNGALPIKTKDFAFVCIVPTDAPA